MTHTNAATAPFSANSDLAIETIRAQGQCGRMKELAHQHNVHPRRIFEVRKRAEATLKREFDEMPADEAENETAELPDDDKVLFLLPITVRHLTRVIVALRVVAPCPIRSIVCLLPILFSPLVKWSFGKIQGILTEAGGRAEAFLKKVDLSAIDYAALDEMFSQGQPVLAGVDLVTQYLFMLEKHVSRKGEEWAEALKLLKLGQNLNPIAIIKDAGTGLAKGVKLCWESIEERADIFHVVMEMLTAFIRLERYAYKKIRIVQELEQRAGKLKTEKDRRKNGQKLRNARQQCIEAIEHFDAFEQQFKEALFYLQFARTDTGELFTAAEVTENLERIGEAMMSLGGKYARKAGRYLKNRAKGLSIYLIPLANNLDAVTEEVGGEELVRAATRLIQTALNNKSKARARNQPERDARADDVRTAIQNLIDAAGGDKALVCHALRIVGPILEQRNRASSGVENFNSVLRPYLVVQKSANQGFLNLFQFYRNTRTRQWGRGKGTSSYEQLTGVKVTDWLDLLDYPPSLHDVVIPAA